MAINENSSSSCAVEMWRSKRRMTITGLEQFQDKLDSLCVVANRGKIIGIGMILCGGLASIVGGVMVFIKSKSAACAMNAGSLLYYSGSLIEASSKLIESLAPEYFLEEMNAILDEDKKRSETVQECLKFPSKLDIKKRLNDLDIESDNLTVESEISVIFDSFIGIFSTLTSMKEGQYQMLEGNGDKIKFIFEVIYKSNKSKIAKILAKSLTNIADKKGIDFFNNLFSGKSKTTASPPTNQMSKVSASADEKNIAQDDGKVKSTSNSVENPSKSPPTNQMSKVSARADEKNIAQDDGKVKSTSNSVENPSDDAVAAFLVFQTIHIITRVIHLLSAKTVIKDGKSKNSDSIREIIRSLESELRENQIDEFATLS
ncbi:unnamed protein product [Larinioides sclopetarius]|uniref:Uncharacterized protein n=1 Tax=Larinioides sclopetarius TaxID=280406 RepID=A0AAV2BLF5_9ARAC